MFSTIEVAAKGLLNDPSWNWVFKNTFDAIEDKLNKVWKTIWNSFDEYLQTLFVVSGLGILVRFISNLASGDLLCIVNDLSDNTTNLDVRSLSSLHIKAICFGLRFLQILVCTVKLCFSFGPSSLSGPFHISLSAYAAQEPGCKEKVKLSHFFLVLLLNSAVPKGRSFL